MIAHDTSPRKRGTTRYTKEKERAFFFYATLAMFIFYGFLTLFAD
jgi:hypothetical protein